MRKQLLPLLILALPLMGFEWDGRIARLRRNYAAGDVAARTEAVRRMGEYSAAQVRVALMQALEDPDDGVRAEAARAAGRVGLSAAVPILADWLEDPDEEVRATAARSLGQLGDPRPLPLLVRALGDISAPVRIAAIVALADLDPRASTVPILGRLDDADGRVRIAAAQALGRTGDPRAVVPLIGRARDSVEVRAAVFAALGQLGDGRATAALVQAMRDEDAYVRLIAIGALGRLGEGRTIAPLSEAALDSDARVAHAAVGAIGGIEGPEAEAALFELLPQPRIQRTVREALAHRQSEGLSERVAQAMRRAPPLQAQVYIDILAARLDAERADVTAALLEMTRRVEAGNETLLRALALAGGDDALVAILGELESHPRPALAALESYFARYDADPRAADPILRTLTVQSPRIRRRAIALLGRIGAPRVVEPLVRLSEAEATRAAALHALADVASQQQGRAPRESDTMRERLREALDSEEASERYEGARGLAGLVSAADMAWILERLDAPPPVDRHAYLRVLRGALGRGELSAGLRGRLERIARGMLASEDTGLADAMVDVLAAWPAPAGRRLLEEAPAARRVAATLALGQRDDGEEPTLARLNDTRANVRIAAAARAARFPNALPRLVTMLGERTWPEPAAASYAIAQLLRARGETDDETAAVLCNALGLRDPIVRANTLMALVFTSRECAAQPIASWVDIPHAPIVRRAAAIYLRSRGERPSLRCTRGRNELDLCASGDVSGYEGTLDLYLHETPQVRQSDALSAIALADGTVMVLLSDARAHIGARAVAEGPVFALDPLRLRLEAN